MNREQRRHPPRPQLIPEQLRHQINSADTPQVLGREQSMYLAVMLGNQLEKLLNDDQRMPWVTAAIDKRSDGFSLHVQVVEPSTQVDAKVVVDG